MIIKRSGEPLLEEDLREDENIFRKFIELSPDALSLTNEDGIIIEFSQGAEMLFGLKRQDTIGKYIWDVQFSLPLPERRTSEDYQHLKSAVRSTLKTGKAPFLSQPVILTVRLSDGTQKDIRQKVFVIPTQKGFQLGSVCYDFTERKKIRVQFEQLTRNLIQAQEEERKRISRELHDEIAQYLALLNLEIDNLIANEAGFASGTVSSLIKLKDTANKAIQEVRRYSHELRPPVLETFGLSEALELLVKEFAERCTIKTFFRVIGHERRLSEEIEIVLYRITQESLNNVLKHSQAAKAEVKLKYTPEKTTLVITDNGKGVDLSQNQPKLPYSGLGIIGMKERAELIGAVINIKSRPGLGTSISVEVPA